VVLERLVPKFERFALKNGEVVKRALIIGETLVGVEIYDALVAVDHAAEDAAMAVVKVGERSLLQDYLMPHIHFKNK
jgi:hypothetical protein